MPIITPKGFKLLQELRPGKIWNVCRCDTCKKILWSSSRHDFVSCKCSRDSETSVFLDGGDDYCHWGYGKDAKISWWDSVNQRWKPSEVASAKA